MQLDMQVPACLSQFYQIRCYQNLPNGEESYELLALSLSTADLKCFVVCKYPLNFFPAEFPLFTKLDGFKGTAKYPQMSQKITVQDSKKKGRHLVAKEKINPGSIEIMFQFRIKIGMIRIPDMYGIQVKHLCPVLEWSSFHILSKNPNLSVYEPNSNWDETKTSISNC